MSSALAALVLVLVGNYAYVYELVQLSHAIVL